MKIQIKKGGGRHHRERAEVDDIKRGGGEIECRDLDDFLLGQGRKSPGCED